MPAAHLLHVVAFVYGLNVPGAHGVGSFDPTEQNVPSGQITHCSTLVIGSPMVAFVCVPSGHGCDRAGGARGPRGARQALLCGS